RFAVVSARLGSEQRGNGKWRIQKWARLRVRGEQRFDLAAKLRVSGAGLVQEELSLRRGQLERVVQKLRHASPACLVHTRSSAIPVGAGQGRGSSAVA